MFYSLTILLFFLSQILIKLPSTLKQIFSFVGQESVERAAEEATLLRGVLPSSPKMLVQVHGLKSKSPL